VLGENKAIRALVPGDEAHFVNYLTATGAGYRRCAEFRCWTAGAQTQIPDV